tara:strand:- start:12392 stop:12727 length:336 start_codon:yes stop_codon:yes gene_type:complete
MNLFLDLLSGFFITTGCFFCLIGAIGIIRFPDIFCRLHASSINETLGTPLILLGLIIQIGPNLISLKLFIVGVFILITNPTATHAISRASLHGGLKPLIDNKMRREKSSKS